MRATDSVYGVINGTLDYDKLSDAAKSCMSLYVFNEAVKLIRIRDKEERTRELDKYPASIKSEIKKEVIRLWNL